MITSISYKSLIALSLLIYNCYATDIESANKKSAKSFSFDLDASDMEIEFDLDFDLFNNALPTPNNEPITTNGDDAKVNKELRMVMDQEQKDQINKNSDHIHNIIDEDNEILISQLSDHHLATNDTYTDYIAEDNTHDTSHKKNLEEKTEPTSPQQENIEPTDYLRLRVLNKTSGKTKTIDAPLRKTINMDNIEILVRKIQRSNEFSAPEIEAFIEIKENNPRKKTKRLAFSGWMFMSNPSISAMEHSVYDVWIEDNSNFKKHQ